MVPVGNRHRRQLILSSDSYPDHGVLTNPTVFFIFVKHVKVLPFGSCLFEMQLFQIPYSCFNGPHNNGMKSSKRAFICTVVCAFFSKPYYQGSPSPRGYSCLVYYVKIISGHSVQLLVFEILKMLLSKFSAGFLLGLQYIHKPTFGNLKT